MKKSKYTNKISMALYASMILFLPFNAANANTLGSNSVYTLSPVGTAANNTITQAVYNPETGAVTYDNYRLNLVNPKTGNNIFGDSTGSTKNHTVQGLSLVSRYSNANYVGKSKSGSGGLISTEGNWSSNINGTFVSNSVTGIGGAVRVDKVNNGNGTIIGNFIENHSSGIAGGALSIGNVDNGGGLRVTGISGNFIGNYVSRAGANSGGAIQFDSGVASEYAVIGDIDANFIGNYVKSTNSYSQGGAFDNGRYSKIGEVKGDFIKNHAESTHNYTSSSYVTQNGLIRGSQGGAIYTFASSEIGNITGDFIENYAKGAGLGSGEGGAIYISASTNIGNIKGSFLSNYAEGVNNAEGGAISNFGKMGNLGGIDSVFNNNSLTVTGASGTAKGGVIANNFDNRDSNTWNPDRSGASIKNITGIFTGNRIVAANANAEGGVIYNHAKSSIASITNSTFEGTQVTAKSVKGGVIYNDGAITNGISNVVFRGNKFGAGTGGVIYNTGTLGAIADTTFSNNSISGNGGAIYTTKGITLKDDVVFTKNTATTGNDIYLANGAGISVTSTKTGSKTVSDGGIASATNASKITVGKNATLELSGDNTKFLGSTTLGDGSTVLYNAIKSIVSTNINGANSNIAYNNIDTATTATLTATTGSTNVTKTGSAKLTLSGNVSSATANVTLAEGDLEHTGNYFSSSVNTINNGSELTINNANNVSATIKAGADGSGTFTKRNSGKVTLTGDSSSYEGVTNVEGGSLVYSDADGSKCVSGDVNLSSGTSLDYTVVNDTILANKLSGLGKFIKKGKGKTTITADNSSLTGNTEIQGGTLAYSNANGVFVGGNVLVSQNAALELTTASDYTLNNLVSGGGNLIKKGDSVLTLNSAKDYSSLTGRTEIQEGTLSYTTGTGAFVGGDVYINENAVLDYTVTKSDTLANNLSGSGTLIKRGTARTTATGDNSDFNGKLDVQAGTLAYSDSTDGAKFFGEGTTYNVVGEFDIENSENVSLNSVSGTGKLVKLSTGTVDLIGDNSGFTGDVTVRNGKISYSSGEGKSFFDAKSYNINGVLELANSGEDALNLRKVVGSGSIIKSEAADLVFTSDKTSTNGFIGSLNVSGGNTVAHVGAQNEAGLFDFDVVVGGEAQLYYDNDSKDKFTLNSDSKVRFAEGASGAGITFNSATFTLGNEVANAAGNTVTMGEKSTVSIRGNSYEGNYSISDGSSVSVTSTTGASFTGDVAIKNSALNLQNNAVTATTFSKLDLGESTDLKIDLSFGNEIVADTIIATSGTGKFKLTDVAVVSSDRLDTNILNTTVKVLTGVEFTADDYNNSISGDNLAYSYSINKISPDSLKITSYHDARSLYILNHLRNGDRTFTWNDTDANNYAAYTDEDDSTLGQTLAGILRVLGRTEDRLDTINATPGYVTKYPIALFDLSAQEEDTHLEVKNVTITDAAGRNGSVISVTSPTASVDVNNVLFKNSESALFIGEDVGTVDGKEVVISNSTFRGNTVADGAIASAIHNEGKLTLNDVTFSNNNDTYIYNKGILNINATKSGSRLANGTSSAGKIINNGTINLTATGDCVDFGITNPISTSVSAVAKGKVFADGVYTIGAELTRQELSTRGTTTLSLSAGLFDSVWTINSGSVGNLKSSVDNSSIINNGTLNITNEYTDDTPINISGAISSTDTSNIIDYSGGGVLNLSANVRDYKGKFNIITKAEDAGKSIVNFVERDTKTFFSGDAEVNIDGGVFNVNTNLKNISVAKGNFATIDLKNGASFNITGVKDGKYVIGDIGSAGDAWITTEGSNNISFTNGEYLFNTILPTTGNTITISNATFGFNDINGEENGTLNGYDFKIGNNYVLKNGSTLDLLVHTHNSATDENGDFIIDGLEHFAGDNYIFDSFNSVGEKGNNISLNLNLYTSYTDDRYPVTDTITAGGGEGILNLVKVGIKDDNGGIFLYDKPLRVIYGANNLQIATKNDIDVLSWSTNVYKYKFTSASSVGIEGISDENSHEADSIRVTYGGLASTDTLRDLNRYNINLTDDEQGGNRGFSFVSSDDYHIYRDLDETTAGHFVVLGKLDNNKNNNVISGKFGDLLIESADQNDRFYYDEENDQYYYDEYIKGQYDPVPNPIKDPKVEEIGGIEYDRISYKEYTEGRDYGSLFEVVNNTHLEMSNVTLKDTLRSVQDIKDGSAFYVNNEDARVELNNVCFENNRVEDGNGGSIANLSSSEFSLTGGYLTGNYASGDGGSIYNTSAKAVGADHDAMILSNITADGNIAGGLGGAIYTSADLTIRNSDFGKTTKNIHGKTADNDGISNDIYIAEGATVTFDTFVDTTSSTGSKDAYIINSGIAGKGNFVKIGEKTLTLSGVNNDFTGNIDVKLGTVNYVQDVANGFVSGSVNLSKDTILNMTNTLEEHIQKMSGTGTFNKNGKGDVALAGDNSKFTGGFNVFEGTTNYIQDTTNGFVSGSVNLSKDTILNMTNTLEEHIQKMSGAGTFNKDGVGNVTLTGDNSGFSGIANINDGSLTYVYEAEATNKYFGGETRLGDATLNVNVKSGSTQIRNISSQSEGSGSLVKLGSGTATFAGDNSSFTGETNVEKGTLAFSDANNSTFVGGDVNLSSGTSLDYTAAKDGNLFNKLSGLGKFIKKGVGKTTLTGDNSDFVGKVDVQAGKLAYSDSNTDAKFFGDGTTYNVVGEFDIDNDKDKKAIKLSTVSGTGAIVKTGTGDITLIGDNSKFNGSANINIKDGSLTFVDDAVSKYISGSTILSKDAILNYTAEEKAELKKVSGDGVLNYYGTESLTFNAKNNSNFTGTANVYGTLLDVIGNTASDNFVMNVHSGSMLNYTAAEDASITINDKFNFVGTGEGSTIQFNGSSYLMNSEIADSTGNNVIFNDTTVAFNGSAYNSAAYTVKDSVIDLTKDNKATSNRTFNDLTVSNSRLKIDVDLLLATGSEDTSNAKADTLTVTNPQDNKISVTLSEIKVNDKSDDGLGGTYNIKVLDGLTFNKTNSVTQWATQAYTYNVTVDSTDLILTAVKASTANSLGEMNRLEGNRGFNFNYTTDDEATYKIGSSLGITSAGTFTVLGDNENKDTIVSGGNQYSMFNVQNKTDLTVSDMSLTNAKASDRGGAVVLANNKDASITLNNVNLRLNESASNGGAINNTKSKDFNIYGGTIRNNTSKGNGGAIYTESDMYILNTNFNNNTDKNGKNDIYIKGVQTAVNYEITQDLTGNILSGLSGDGIFNKTGAGLLNLSGRNSGFTGTLNVLDGSEVIFNQASVGDSYILGTTNIGDNGQLTLNNDKSNITIGNLRGNTGTAVNVVGGYDVTLSRDNSGFSGDLNIENGSVSFNSYSANDKYIKGQTKISEDASLKLLNDNDFVLERISGEGSLVKNGIGRLIVSGTNRLNGEITINQGELAFKHDGSLGDLEILRMNDGTALNMQNTVLVRNSDGTFTTNPNPANIEDIFVSTIVLNGNSDLKLDIDLKNEQADKIGADVVLGNGQFIIRESGLNVLSDTLLDNTSVQISYGALASDKIALDKTLKTVMGPIQKYSVSYADGYLDFARMGGYTPSYNDINPSVMATPVAAQIGGCLTQLETLQSGFFHMDRYMKYPKAMRLSAEQNNRYAINDNPVYNGSVLPETSQAMWTKPYVTFEKVDLRGGPGVSTITYGNIYGGDSNLYDLKNGFKGVISAFVGYNGSSQDFSGITLTQNGGTLGATATLYKNNFFTGLTISTGASSIDANTYAGHDDFTMLTAGIASKTGYNFEFKEGKFTIQPSLFLGYTFVNTFDYRNKADISINSSPLHAIQVAPGVKFIGNLRNNIQVYASTDVVMNFLGTTNTKANDVTLPQVSVKPYVQYGLGIQKRWSDKFTAFTQAMIRNGGRNGIAFTAGFRWALGKNNKKQDKQIVPVKHKIIKSSK